MNDLVKVKAQIRKARLAVVLTSFLAFLVSLGAGLFVQAVGHWLEVPRFAGGLVTGIAYMAAYWSMYDMVRFEIGRLRMFTERRDRIERAAALA